MLEYHKTTEEEKYIISEWKYGGEYSVYNTIPYEEQKQKGQGFANPQNLFYSYVDGEILVGYINLIEEESEVFFGIGVSPELCGRGYGQEMTRMALVLSRQLYPGKIVYLKVRTWNKRAVRCYEKAGFCITGEPIVQETPVGEDSFYRMIAEVKG